MFSCFLSQVRPIPLAISVAKKGIDAKPISSIFIITLNLETNLLVTLGNSPLLRGKAQLKSSLRKIY